MSDDYWPEAVDGSVWNCDDAALRRWRDGLIEDLGTYVNDAASVWSIRRYIKLIEEELAYRQQGLG